MFFKKKWTNEKLRDALRQYVPPEYRVEFDAEGVGVKIHDNLAAYIELTFDGKEAVVAFSALCWPAFAAELALILSGLLNTYIDAETGFVAGDMADLREGVS